MWYADGNERLELDEENYGGVFGAGRVGVGGSYSQI